MNCAGASLLLLLTCLGDANPEIRDKLAFERLSVALRAGDVDRATLVSMRSSLLQMIAAPDPGGFQRSFAALTLGEVARTDRMKPWMSDAERQQLVDAAAVFLTGITDYRAYSDREGFVHAVAHGADLALQLVLNPATTRPQLDRLLGAVATQVAPNAPAVAYWAGEPDRLARVVLFTAQRKLHTDTEWKAWFAALMKPEPLASWTDAFRSERGIRRRHNVRAFLLSVFASASISEDAGVKLLAPPTRESLKMVP